VAQQPNSGLGRLFVEVSTLHSLTHTHIHTVERLGPSDQLVAEAANYTTHNKHKRRSSMPSAGFEPAIPGIELLQNNALDRMDTVRGISDFTQFKYEYNRICFDRILPSSLLPK
jgi:hypothetical protein